MDYTQHIKHVTHRAGQTFRVGQSLFLNGHEPLALRDIQVRTGQTRLVLEDRGGALLTMEIDVASEAEALRERSVS